jgi:hypothetical protein
MASIAQPISMLFASLTAAAPSGFERRELLDRLGRTSRYDADLPLGGRLGTPEHGRGHEELPGLAMHGIDLAQHFDAVRAHRDVDRALVERARDLLDDLPERLVVGHHADDDFAAAAGIRDRVRDFRALLLELRALLARAVVDDEIVPAAQKARGHGLTHSTEADETYLHLTLPFAAVQTSWLLTHSSSRCT